MLHVPPRPLAPGPILRSPPPSRHLHVYSASPSRSRRSAELPYILYMTPLRLSLSLAILCPYMSDPPYERRHEHAGGWGWMRRTPDLPPPVYNDVAGSSSSERYRAPFSSSVILCCSGSMPRTRSA
eukprot:scaffold35000_cov112-Isochrysis_galbana.AAC.2